jgi:Calx-beta domain-containing protein
MQARLLTIIAALVALALVPSSALAAPKKAQIKFSATAYSVAENASTFNVVVQRSGNTSNTASANVQIDSSSTAVGGGVDYSYSGPSSLTFNPGEVSKALPITIVDNSTANAPNKKIVFTLSGASPAGTQLKNSPTTVTIIDNEGPGTLNLSSNAYSVVEGSGAATITVNRLGASNLALSVDYATATAASNPATPTADYTPISPAKTLTFAPGEMSKTFQVPITDDGTPEGDESVNVVLSNPKNLSGGAAPQMGNSPAVVTITDDDTYSFTSSLYSVNENDSSGQASILVSRAGSPNVPATINFSTSNGTAVAPGDYTATNVPVNFAVGETTTTVNVPIVNDSDAEGNESVNLRLSYGATTLATSLLTIVDNDNPKASVQLSDVAYSVTEGDPSGVATLTVSLTHAVDADVTVNYATSDGTASAGADYTATSGTLTFKGNLSNGGTGETQKTITVPIANDSVPSDSRTFNVTLSNVGPGSAAVAGAPASGVVTILDDDPAGDVQFDVVSYEGGETDGHATVTVERVGGRSGTVTVDYATSDGTATAGSDYTATNGTLTFNPGDTTETFDIPITWDGQAEGADETVNLTLFNPSGGSDIAANGGAVLYIADDGASGPTRFTADSYSVDETAGMVTITVTRTGGSLGGPVSVDYTTGDGTAAAGSDYTAASGTLTFGPSEATKSFTVPISKDSAYEGNETFQVTLSNPTGGAAIGSPSGATVTIADDEQAPVSQDQPANNLQSTPNPEGSQTAATDKRAPKVSLSAKKIQKAFKVKLLALAAKCDENCSLAVVAKAGKGRKAITLGKAKVKTARGAKATIKVKLSHKMLAKLTKLIRRGKLGVTISVVASDAAGNKGTATRAITMKR